MFRNAIVKTLAIVMGAFSLMAFTDAKVSTRNAESLDASLQLILQPMSQADRKTFMSGFFDYAHFEECRTNSGPRALTSGTNTLESCREAIGGRYGQELAMRYIADRRMDGKVQYATVGALSGTQHHGHSAAMSYTIFIDRFGVYVDGKSANEIMEVVRREGAIGDKTEREAIVKDLTAQVGKLEAELAQWEENLPKINRLGAKLGTGGQAAKYTAQCQRAIEHRRKVLARKRAILYDNDYSMETGSIMAPSGARCVTVNGVRGLGRVNLSDLPATNAVTPKEAATTSDAMFKGAMNAIQLIDSREFKAVERARAMEISFKAVVAFESPRSKPVKRVEYAMAVIPRKNDRSMVAVRGRALDLTRTGGDSYQAAPRRVNKRLSRGYEDFIGATADDVIILPFIREIHYEDGTADYIVDDDGAMMRYLIRLVDQATAK